LILSRYRKTLQNVGEFASSAIPGPRTERANTTRPGRACRAALASDSFNAFIARQLRIKARVFVHTIGAVKHPTGVAEKFSFDGKNCRRVGWVAQEKDNAAAKK
jgi:hypothetical protein